MIPFLNLKPANPKQKPILFSLLASPTFRMIDVSGIQVIKWFSVKSENEDEDETEET